MTWSLYKKREEEETRGGANESLSSYENAGFLLDPKKFSNGKTQEDIVKEILDEIQKGTKTIFLRGVCGSGKSAIALNLAKHFKKSSIVVPIKSLQEQYERDYTQDKFLLKDDKQKLKISVIKGRNNFNCPFLHIKADSRDLPCTIELREKNMERIKEFIRQNPFVDITDFQSIQDVKRFSVAPCCQYWSPLMPAGIEAKSLKQARKREYKTSSGKDYALFVRQKGCEYYNQYNNYLDSDVLIFNAQKYLIETALGRKPKTELDIIDECDEFLDSFSEEKRINFTRLISALSNLFPKDQQQKNTIKKLILALNKTVMDVREAPFQNTEVEKLPNTEVYETFKTILENPYLAEDDEENYYNRVFEIVKNFEEVIDEAYLSFERRTEQKEDNSKLFRENFSNQQDTINAVLVTINLDQRFQSLIDSTDVLVLMSGTLHSEQVLKDIFGLKNFKIIEAETRMPGMVLKCRTGLEKNCNYESFKSNQITREQYLKALSNCLKSAKEPSLIHVNSFDDLPNELEKVQYDLTNLITKQELLTLQEKSQEEIEKFKSGKIKTLFTTKCSRGVDFPGEKCNSVIITKYPYPNVQGMFWKILKKEKPDKYWEFYFDKAKRDLLQKIYRGVRSEDDSLILLSPDTRVLNARLD